MNPHEYEIPNGKFVFCANETSLCEPKPDTRRTTFLGDALNRFVRNKASVLAAVIIGLLLLFAAVGPLLTPYSVSYEDVNYAYALPKNPLFVKLGIRFWDGGQKKEVNETAYHYYRAIEEEIRRPVIMTEPIVTEEAYMGKNTKLYAFRLDTYNAVGMKFVLLTTAEYEDLQRYQEERGVLVIYPMTDPTLRPEAEQDNGNANYWYMTRAGTGRKTQIVYDESGHLIPIYQADTGQDHYTCAMYMEGDVKRYSYAEKKDGDLWSVRVDYREYYIYRHAAAGDGVQEPVFLFGTNDTGRDLLAGLASGARFSFLLSFAVAVVNLFVGALYGAVEGYYGGKTDLIMERIVDILSAIPFMIVIILLKYHFNVSHILLLFIAFFLTGWTGMAGRTRMQFYRYKNREYVLVAKTLGAKDRRIMFKHILPNAIGTLITGSVLMIPGVIFSETSLSYLGIIDLNTGSMTSIGTLLAKGQNFLFTYPHMILFPAVFISLLMLCFNLFGNGLRDAFNPSLRGAED